MGFQSEFAEILKEKMGETPIIQDKKPQQSFAKSHFFNEFFTQFSTKKTWRPQSISHVYPIKKQSHCDIPSQISEKTTIQERQVEPVFSKATLDKTKQTALLEFIKLGAHLNIEKLKYSEIKKEYRRLLKVYHPDHSKTKNSTQSFEKVIKSYRTLVHK